MRYDMAGQLVRATGSTGALNYEYDQVVKTCGDTGVGVEYTYDSNGNLLSQTSSFITTATVTTHRRPYGSPRWIQSGMVATGSHT